MVDQTTGIITISHTQLEANHMTNPQGGGGGYSRFQVTGMIVWEQKSRPQKIPRASSGLTTLKTLPRTKNTQKNPYLNQATQKILNQIFLPKNNPGVDNFKPPKILLSST